MNTTSWNHELAKTWQKYLPPIRPYKEEIEVIRGAIKQYIEVDNNQPSILILGSTPELRDLVCDLGLVPTVVDYSEDNYMAMGALKKLPDAPEKFFKSDWLKFDPPEMYDLILSEAALNVVDSQSSKILYKKCHDFLKPNGKLIAKQWLRVANDNSYMVEDLISAFRRAKNYPFGFYSFTCIPLMLCFYDFANEAIYLRSFNECCKRLYDLGQITQEEWETIAIHQYEKVDLQLYIPNEIDFMTDIKQYFSIDESHDIRISFSQYHPIYILTRRQ